MKIPPYIDIVCTQATQLWGTHAQEQVAIGELGELLTLFGRRQCKRSTTDEWVDEIADSIIMLHQLAHLHGVEAVEQRIAEKLVKIQRRIAAHEAPMDTP